MAVLIAPAERSAAPDQTTVGQSVHRWRRRLLYQMPASRLHAGYEKPHRYLARRLQRLLHTGVTRLVEFPRLGIALVKVHLISKCGTGERQRQYEDSSSHAQAPRVVPPAQQA